jgi:hypothetical protein
MCAEFGTKMQGTNGIFKERLAAVVEELKWIRWSLTERDAGWPARYFLEKWHVAPVTLWNWRCTDVCAAEGP